MFLHYVIILFAGLISLTWFGQSDFLLSVDSLFPTNLNFITEYFSIWSTKMAFGLSDVIKLPILFPFSYFLRVYDLLGFTFNGPLFERIWIYVLFSSTGLTTYFLSFTSFPKNNKWTHLVAAFMYMFGFYTMFIYNALPMFLMLSHSFIPLILALYIRLLKKGTQLSAMGLGFLAFFLLIGSYASTPYIIIHVLLLFSYFVFQLMQNQDQRLRYIKLSFTTGIVAIALGSFWLYPFIFTQKPSIEDFRLGGLASQRTFALNSSRPVDSFRLQGYFGFKEEYRGVPFYSWFENYLTPPLVLMSFIPTILAFSGFFYIKRKSKEVHLYLYYAVLAVVLLFFISSTYLPTYFLWSFIGEKLLFFDIFRTGYQRFSGFLALFMALMVGFTLNFIVAKAAKNHKRAPLYIFFSMFVFIGIYGYPLFTAEIFERNEVLPSKRVTFPKYYYELTDWLSVNSSNKGNVLVVPFNNLALSSLWWGDGHEGYDSIHPLVQLSNQRILYGENYNDMGKYVGRYISDAGAPLESLIRILDLDFILFHKDTNWRFVQRNPWWTNTNPEHMVKRLNNDPCLEDPLEFGELLLYRTADHCARNRAYVGKKPKDIYLFGGVTDLLDAHKLFPELVRENVNLMKSSFVERLMVREDPLAASLSDVSWSQGGSWPEASVSPKSPLHFLVRLRERGALLRVRGDPGRYLDTLTWQIAKRTRELERWELSAEDKKSLFKRIDKDMADMQSKIMDYQAEGIVETLGDQLWRAFYYLQESRSALVSSGYSEYGESFGMKIESIHSSIDSPSHFSNEDELVLVAEKISESFENTYLWDYGWFWPNARLSPESPLHFLVRIKEEFELRTIRNDEIKQMDALTWRIAKRLEELSKWSDLSKKTQVRQLDLISADINKLKELSESSSGNFTRRVLFSQLRKTYAYLQRGKGSLPEGFLLDALNDELSGFVVESNIELDYCYDVCFMLVVPKSGEFIMMESGFVDAGLVPEYLLNGEPLLFDGDRVNLSKGKYVLGVKLSQRPNLVENSSWIRYGESLAGGESLNFDYFDVFREIDMADPYLMEINDWVKETPYDVKFEYKIEEGGFVVGAVETSDNFGKYDTNKEIFDLAEKGALGKHSELKRIEHKKIVVPAPEWRSVSFGFNSGELTFSPAYVFIGALHDEKSDETNVEIRNLQVVKRLQPSVLFRSTDAMTKTEVVQPMVTRMTESFYKVELESIPQEEFDLVFAERFDSGWTLAKQPVQDPAFIQALVRRIKSLGARLIFLDDSSIFLEDIVAPHERINGFSNVWRVDPEQLTSNVFYIKFTPGENLYIGVALSFMTFIVLFSTAGLLIIKRKKT